jgi:two-component system chemotaxis response regulator CheB
VGASQKGHTVAGRDVIVIGASAGGVEALTQIVRGLPPGFPAAVFVVCHFPPGSQSALPEILSRQGPLLARHVRDGEPTYPGHVYVAPPDLHLVVEPGAARLVRGPRENRFRPSIDPLFRSAARVYGPRVIAVTLSGALLDGVAGLMAVRTAAGLSVVQSPEDAVLPDLPRAAIEMAGADRVAPAAELGPLLTRLVQEPIPGVAAVKDAPDKLTLTTEHDLDAQTRNGKAGTISVFTCPECGGALWQGDDDRLIRFRCHVGHAYSGEALLSEKAEALEGALWTALRMFKEKTVLARQLAQKANRAGDASAAERFEDEARLAQRHGEAIQQWLSKSEAGESNPPAGQPG